MHRITFWALAALLSAFMAGCGGGGDYAAPAAAAATGPTITIAPASVSTGAGQTATFSVAASGAGTLSYQWQLNTVDIPGATAASYTTPTLATTASGGSYRVRVINASGTTTSSAATLSVGVVAAGDPADNQETAEALANEAYDALAAADRRSVVPSGVQITGGLPTGVLVNNECPAGGSFSFDLPNSIIAGTSWGVEYNACAFAAGYQLNGSYVITYSAFTDLANFGWLAQYSMTYTGPNLNYSISGTQTCRFSAGLADCTFSDGTRTFGNGFSYGLGTINGSYQWRHPRGATLSFSFSNWRATSGSLGVSGSNGFTASILRTAVNTFSITINGGPARVIIITRP